MAYLLVPDMTARELALLERDAEEVARTFLTLPKELQDETRLTSLIADVLFAREHGGTDNGQGRKQHRHRK